MTNGAQTTGHSMDRTIRGTIKWPKAMGQPALSVAEGVPGLGLSEALEIHVYTKHEEEVADVNAKGEKTVFVSFRPDADAIASFVHSAHPVHSASEYVLNYVIRFPPHLPVPTSRLVRVSVKAGHPWHAGPDTPAARRPAFVPDVPGSPVFAPSQNSAVPFPGFDVSELSSVDLDGDHGWGWANFVLDFRPLIHP